MYINNKYKNVIIYLQIVFVVILYRLPTFNCCTVSSNIVVSRSSVRQLFVHLRPLFVHFSSTVRPPFVHCSSTVRPPVGVVHPLVVH